MTNAAALQNYLDADPTAEERYRINYRKSLILTCNHPSSSYGVPVVVGNDGIAYGPADWIPTLCMTGKLVARAMYEDGEITLDEYCRYGGGVPTLF